VIILDNASTDDSLNILSQKADLFIQNAQNLGFGKAVNKGMEEGKGKYVLLLNPDTKSSFQVLEKLVEKIEANPLCASIGPQQRDENDKILRTCGRFPNFLTSLYDLIGLSKLVPGIFKPAPIMFDWDHKTSRIVDHVMGSYMLLRRSALEQTGYFDDDYFVYYEDLDLSIRLKKMGYYSYFDSSVSIQHEGGGSGQSVKAKRLFYSIDARRIYWKKHLNSVSFLFLVFISFIAEPGLRLFSTLFGKDKANVFEIIKAYKLYLKSIFR
jgi:GT2 family glycosyltransferase